MPPKKAQKPNQKRKRSQGLDEANILAKGFRLMRDTPKPADFYKENDIERRLSTVSGMNKVTKKKATTKKTPAKKATTVKKTASPRKASTAKARGSVYTKKSPAKKVSVSSARKPSGVTKK